MKTIIFGQPAKLFLLLLFSFLSLQTTLAAISTKQSGSWSSASTWEGGIVPTNYQDVIIKAGHTVTRSNAFVSHSYLYVYGTLVYLGNVAREFYPGNSIEIDGTLRIDAGTLRVFDMVYGDGTFRQTGGNTIFSDAYVVENTDIQAGTVYFENLHNGNLHLDYLTLKNATLNANGNTDLVINVAMNWNNGGKVLAGTSLRIDDGATLTFDGGNSKHYNDGFINNFGSMYCSSGAIEHISGTGVMYNYGYWEFNVQANASSYVTSQYVVNAGGEILKKGPGSVTFSSSGNYFDEGDPTFHVQQGGADITTNSSGHELNGTWKVDANAALLAFSHNVGQSVPFNPTRWINHGNVYGPIRFVGTGDNVLEGDGAYDRMEISKSGGVVTLNGSPAVTQAFTLTSGRIVLNQYDLHLGSASISYSSDYDSYIETNGTGSCERTCPVGGYILYPIGQADFAPFFIQLTAGSTQDQIKVRVTDAFYGEYTGNTPACSEEIPVGVVGHNWLVSEQTAGGSAAIIAAYWLNNAERNGFDRSQCTLGQYINGAWQADNFSPAENAAPLFEQYRSNVTAFGLFGVFDASHEPDVNFITPTITANNPVCEWDDLQLQVHTSPNAAIEWAGPDGIQSSDVVLTVPAVQLSQSGVYTATAAQYGCLQKWTTVNIIVHPLPVASILGSSQIQPGETVALTAYGGIAYQWSTGVTTQTIAVAPVQTTDYQVSVTSAAGCTDMALHTVQVVGTTAATEAPGTVQEMKITPNPANESATLTFQSSDAGEAQWMLFDARGVQISRQQMAIVSGQNQVNISLANLPAGTYQVSLIKENEVKTTRVVKLMGE